MDFLEELENAVCHFDLQDNEKHCIDDEVVRWKSLFKFTTEQAQQELDAFRTGTSSIVNVPNELWDIVRDQALAEGHSRESYAYSLTKIRPSAAPQHQRMRNTNPLAVHGRYAIQLQPDSPIDSAATIQKILNLSCIPKTYEAEDEDGQEAHFCILPALRKLELCTWLAQHQPNYHLVSARISKAEKCLDNASIRPWLGIDTTLPQHRPSTTAVVNILPRQNEYPVWYFFYGRLADAETLKGVLELEAEPVYRKVMVRGGKMCRWGGKYNALVNGESAVLGQAFLVSSEEDEDRLRFFETDMYEVVRCGIRFYDGGEEVTGLCFRFCGPDAVVD